VTWFEATIERPDVLEAVVGNDDDVHREVTSDELHAAMLVGRTESFFDSTEQSELYEEMRLAIDGNR